MSDDYQLSSNLKGTKTQWKTKKKAKKMTFISLKRALNDCYPKICGAACVFSLLGCAALNGKMDGGCPVSLFASFHQYHRVWSILRSTQEFSVKEKQ